MWGTTPQAPTIQPVVPNKLMEREKEEFIFKDAGTPASQVGTSSS